MTTTMFLMRDLGERFEAAAAGAATTTADRATARTGRRDRRVELRMMKVSWWRDVERGARET